MKFEFRNLTDLLVTFNTEAKCEAYLEQQRWNGKVICPHCGHEKVYRTNRGFKCASPACYKKFTVKVGTYFEASNIKLQKWFAAMYLSTAHKKGISSCQLARDLGVSQKCAWFMLHRIRAVMNIERPDTLLTGEIEIDETYVGGKAKNKSKSERKRIAAQQGGNYHVMSPVVGMLQRKGELIYKATGGNSADGNVIKPLITKQVEGGETIITDGYGGYFGLHSAYNHQIVNHHKDEWIRGNFHTNGIEGAFSLLKRGIYGIYHQVSAKHLQAYCNEFSFRYNSRKITDDTRFSLSLTQVKGRLTYKQLVYGNQAQEEKKS